MNRTALEGLHIPFAAASDAQRPPLAVQAAVRRVVVDCVKPTSYASIAGTPRDDRCLAELVQHSGWDKQFQLDLILYFRSRTDRNVRFIVFGCPRELFIQHASPVAQLCEGSMTVQRFVGKTARMTMCAAVRS